MFVAYDRVVTHLFSPVLPKTQDRHHSESNVKIRTRLEGGLENGGGPGAQPGAARWQSNALPAESEQKNVEAVRNSEGVRRQM